MGDTPKKEKGVTHGRGRRIKEEEQRERESIWEAVWG
jgi:hypothetical protein